MAEPVKKSSRVIDSWKLKRWYKVLAPAVFNNNLIGETVAAEEQSLIGRTLTTSLMNVVGEPKKQSIIGTFEIVSVKNGNAETRLKKMEIAPPSVRRMIRKGKERLDLSFLCATKDNVVVRIKPLLITRGKTGGSVLTKIREITETVSRIEANKISYEELIQDILTTKLQRRIRQVVNKLYPLKSAEIRAIEITTTAKPLPPIKELPEMKEEQFEETEEEKIEKKVKAKEKESKEEASEETEEEKPKKAKKAKKKE